MACHGHRDCRLIARDSLLPSEKITTLKVSRSFTFKPKPESSLDCLACATFIRQRGFAPHLAQYLPLFEQGCWFSDKTLRTCTGGGAGAPSDESDRRRHHHPQVTPSPPNASGSILISTLVFTAALARHHCPQGSPRPDVFSPTQQTTKQIENDPLMNNTLPL